MNIDASTVTQLCNGKLSGAMVGNKLNRDHPDVLAYIEERRLAKLKRNNKIDTKPSKPKVPPVPKPYIAPKNKRLVPMIGRAATNEELAGFGDMTLRQLLNDYGSDHRFYELLKSTKTLEEINEKRIKNATQEGSLVSRDLVRAVVFSLLDAAFVHLVDDTPRTLAALAHNAFKAGESVEFVEDLNRKGITTQLRNLKSRSTAALENL